MLLSSLILLILRFFGLQVKKFGRKKKAIEKMIGICSDKDILKEYLESHRKEVVDIMTQLYDREREMKLYVKEREQEAANDATRKSTLENIRNLMETMKWSAKEAMNAMKIAPKDQKTYLPMLKKG